MPVYTLKCPDCAHMFQGMVFAGARPPREWVCSRCGGRKAAPEAGSSPEPHPWEHSEETGGCLCCGPVRSPREARGAPRHYERGKAHDEARDDFQ